MRRIIHRLMTMTFLFFSIFGSICFTGCSNGVSSLDDLLSDYNKNFTMPNTQTERKHTEPGDKDFDPATMLLENYFVIDTGSFVVAAPENCASYNWKIAKTSALGTPLQIRFLGNLTASSREFAIYIPNSGLETGSYRLTLTIETQDGKKYTDVCRLVIYNE